MSKSKEGGMDRRDFLKRSAVGTAVGAAATQLGRTEASAATDVTKTRSYNPTMEYRPLGDTGLMVSAVCLGGHWKRVDTLVPGVFGDGGKWLNADLSSEGFNKNRYDVVSRCIEHGINYIDACTWQECVTYAKALKGRRDSAYMGFSWYQEEMRKEDFRTADALMGTLEKGMKEAGLDYVDVWRITMLSTSGRHTEGEVEEMMKGLAKAKEQGKARFTGLSSHDRPHIKWMIETYPEVVDVVCTPFTAGTQASATDSVFEAAKKNGTGIFGIKPFGGNSLFKGDSTLDGELAGADDETARLAIRYILSTDSITAPIPGMINTHQVDNLARAIQEPRELDEEEKTKLSQATQHMWANLPPEYAWLRDWEYA
jgi:predicted aldo/keto reductase-like oxidoreductase